MDYSIGGIAVDWGRIFVAYVKLKDQTDHGKLLSQESINRFVVRNTVWLEIRPM